MEYFKRHLITVIGVLVGLAAGYLYWLKVGCLSGSCPITSSPFNSSIYGAMMGGLFFNMFQKDNKQQNKQ
jgi:xanthine/uracil permease